MTLSVEEQRIRKNARLRRWRAQNRDHILARQRLWRENNQDKVREYNRRGDSKRTSEQRKQRYAVHVLWRRKNKDKISAYDRNRWANRTDEQRLRHSEIRRKYYIENPQDPQRVRGNYLKRKYGLSLEQWNTLFESQDCCCALCKTTDPGKAEVWCTDHCHKTNKVRMILCNDCNVILGLCREDMDRLRIIIANFEGFIG